jgi:hypothetical protein
MASAPKPVRTTISNPRNTVIEFTRAIIDRVVDRPDRVAISEIVEQVERRLLSDQQFAMSLAIQNTREIVRAAVREAIAETRGPSRKVIVRDFITTPQDMLAQSPALMAALALRWGRFLEWDGTQHLRLTAMRRPDLLRAAAIRRERAEQELMRAELWEALAAKLPDDETTVEQGIPFEVIEQENLRIQQKYGVADDVEKGETDTPSS